MAILDGQTIWSGFEGGMTNGQPLIIRGVMKPIPTFTKPLMSVDIDTHEPYKATVSARIQQLYLFAGCCDGICCCNGYCK